MTVSSAAQLAEPTLAFIGLGANLGPALATVRLAREWIAALPTTQVVKTSRIYRTPAWGRTDQADFINGAIAVTTQLSPLSLLQALLALEYNAGRRRVGQTRWGPRVLDLDLLLYGDQSIDHPRLTVPHPYLHARAFVLAPLRDIDADLLIPGHGRVWTLLHRLGDCGIVPVCEIMAS